MPHVLMRSENARPYRRDLAHGVQVQAMAARTVSESERRTGRIVAGIAAALLLLIFAGYALA
jgi:hypothetical protein